MARRPVVTGPPEQPVIRRQLQARPGTASSGTSESAGTTAPDLVGMRCETLRNDGYTVGAEVPEDDENRPILEPVNWVVTAQAPAAGTPVEGGTRFLLTVARPLRPDERGRDRRGRGAGGGVPRPPEGTGRDAVGGLFYVTASDATGQGRQQLVDRNWVVVSQSEPAGGSPEPTTRSTWGR